MCFPVWMRRFRKAPSFTQQNMLFLDLHGGPPGQNMVACCGLDARGLPKFRVRAGRREVRRND